MKSNAYYIGCDIGSTSVKAVAIDEELNIARSSYVRNEGIIESVNKGIQELNLPEGCRVRGLGVTGSGRELGGALLRADLIKTEILAHAKAVLHKYPEVRTIFEIGGEDCKLIALENGRIRDFQMNTICGGGTGAMLETIAGRIGVSVGNIGELALKARSDVSIAGKCGIFAQSTVVSKINLGVRKEDILMGVCRALVSNYFSMLAKGKDLEGPYIFQGATAHNSALVSCFEEEIGDPVIVPEQPHLMGAIGMAIYVSEIGFDREDAAGFGEIRSDFTAENIKSDRCPNRCEITYLYRNNEFIGCFGNRCEACSKR